MGPLKRKHSDLLAFSEREAAVPTPASTGAPPRGPRLGPRRPGWELGARAARGSHARGRGRDPAWEQGARAGGGAALT